MSVCIWLNCVELVTTSPWRLWIRVSCSIATRYWNPWFYVLITLLYALFGVKCLGTLWYCHFHLFTGLLSFLSCRCTELAQRERSSTYWITLFFLHCMLHFRLARMDDFSLQNSSFCFFHTLAFASFILPQGNTWLKIKTIIYIC